MKNPRLSAKAMLATVAITGLMAGAAGRAQAATTSNGSLQMHSPTTAGLLADSSDKGKHDCKGMNSCKGQGGCKSSDNGCKGQNSCKGKGGCATNKSKA